MLFAIATGGAALLSAQQPATGKESSLAPLYEAIAKQRARANLPPLAPSPQLAQLASDWARHLARNGDLVHRANLARIMADSGWWALTENLHFSSKPFDASTVLAHWMASKPHRRNLLDPNVTHIGLGLALDKDGQPFTVFNAAKFTQPPAQPVAGIAPTPDAPRASPIPAR